MEKPETAADSHTTFDELCKPIDSFLEQHELDLQDRPRLTVCDERPFADLGPVELRDWYDAFWPSDDSCAPYQRSGARRASPRRG